MYVVYFKLGKFNIVEMREKEALTLRKKKTDEIINAKRKQQMDDYILKNDFNNCLSLFTREEYLRVDQRLKDILTKSNGFEANMVS
jgi:hypothetical protein